jgi:hypothetical protein
LSLQYTLGPHAIEEFEKYATTWPSVIERFSGAADRAARAILAERRSFLRKV